MLLDIIFSTFDEVIFFDDDIDNGFFLFHIFFLQKDKKQE